MRFKRKNHILFVNNLTCKYSKTSLIKTVHCCNFDEIRVIFCKCLLCIVFIFILVYPDYYTYFNNCMSH